MPSFKAPTGDTSASRIKTLVLSIERTVGVKEADAFLHEIGVSRKTIQDETTPVSVAIWARAIDQFVRRYGVQAMARTAVTVLHPTNLGPWVQLIRVAETVENAFQCLDGNSTQFNSTMRYETIETGEFRWRGRLHVSHDPTLEHGGLLSAARKAELAAVPTIFGLPRAKVKEMASLERGDSYYEYEARWRIYELRWPVVKILFGVAIVSTIVIAFVKSPLWFATLPLITAAITIAGLYLYNNEQTRRAQVRAQSLRIRALERSIELQELPKIAGGLGDLEGSVIAGLYRLRSKLGSGATGVIYEAMRVSDGASVAVKLLRAAVAQDSVASDRLQREAEALRLTWHPNVVELYDYGHLPDGSSYIVMELLRGESLATRLSREKKLTGKELFPIIDQICDALSAMHAAGVIHRDLKPSNIFLCELRTDLRASNNYVPRDPTAPRVKIFDFGIARVEWAETRITNNGVALGTPGYMAPEQERGEDVDSRVDIFALGAVIYECLTGNPPPLRYDYSESAIQSNAGSPSARWRVLSIANEPSTDVEEGWRFLIDKAMASSVEDRFVDARALQNAMHALMTDGKSGTIAKATNAIKATA